VNVRQHRSTLTVVLLAVSFLIGNAHADSRLSADSFDSGFAQAHATFNGMLAASDGKVYYGRRPAVS
jgi:hypothetical protein